VSAPAGTRTPGFSPTPTEGDEEAPAGPAWADTAAPVRPTWRRVLTAIGWAAAVTLGGLLVALVAGRPAPGDYLHPDGTGPGGTRALVEVLRGHGIDVRVVGTSDEVARAAGRNTTVVVGNTDLLSSTSANRVLEGTRGADRVVLLDGAPAVLDGLGLGLRAERTSVEPDAGCAAPWADSGDRLTRASWSIVADGATLPDTATACFALPVLDEASGGAADGGHAVVELPATATHARVTVVGAPDAATNRFVTEAQNAGLMVRLLGGSPRLVWFIPTASDLAANPGPEQDSVWPAWLPSVLVLVGVAVVVLALARGRRLGRLVPEPLPVVVRAAETTESRAELYRAAQDRPRAAVVLRRATAARLAARLGLPTTAHPATLVPAVADATGVPAPEVEALLVGPVPTDDDGLVTLARQLAHLEEKARRP
jgi:hypothetical protein